jgi:hypothetical protein
MDSIGIHLVQKDRSVSWANFYVKKLTEKKFLLNSQKRQGSGSAVRKKCWIRIRFKSMRISNPALKFTFVLV